MDIELAKKVSVEAVRAAGKILAARFRNAGKPSFKGKNDIVTEADFEAEKAIITHIQSNFPDHRILSEESGFLGGDSEYLWVTDPLDGTINYYYGCELFQTGLCLLEKNALLIAAMYDPLKDELFFAERGKGATMNGSQIRVRDNAELAHAVIMTGLSSKDEARAKTISVLETLFRNSMQIRMFGCGFASMAWVANGTFDVFLSVRTNPWDILPGALIVEEAGGKVTDIHGGEITSESISVLATNGKVHDQMLELLHNI